MGKWTEEEDAFLAEMYPDHGKLYCAQALGRTESMIRTRASRLGLRANQQSDHFKEWQKRAAESKVGKKRPDQALVIKRLHTEGKLNHHKDPEWRADTRKRMVKWHRDNEHPRGMLGKPQPERAKRAVSEASKKRWADPASKLNSEEHRQSISDRMVGPKKYRSYSRSRSGKREDLGGLYVRSTWEANYARILNWQVEQAIIHKWEYEPDTFYFEAIKRGTRSYTPDFKIWETPGSEPYYVEVKGWMDAKSKTKLKRMAKYYPAVRIDLLEKKRYTALTKQFKGMLPMWE